MKTVIVILALGLMGCADDSFQSIPAGPTGPAGSIGATGPQGAVGATGPQGNSGISPGIACDGYAITTASYQGTVNWDTLYSTGTLLFTDAVLPSLDNPQTLDTAVFNGITPNQAAELGTTNWALDCYGYISVPETGLYTFSLSSDDGSELAIDNAVVINMPQSQDYPTETAAVQLFAGQHKLNVLYFQSLPTQIGLVLEWQGPSNAGLGTMNPVPASAFTH